MKPWLVDVPVKINIWIRPELQKKQWEVIKQARPSILFIQSDGGRNEEEWAAIKQNRELIDNGIDWDCEVHKLYENENLGLYTMGFKRNKYIWEHVDRCIFLEDDLIPSISYFRFCAGLLEKYKDDQRIEAICGFNTAVSWNRSKDDYFFSRRGSIWGMATWRDRVVNQKISDYSSNPYFLQCIESIKTIDEPIYNRIIGYTKNEYYENHLPGSEFWHRFNIFAYHRLFIVATKNMISCQGATANSAHAVDYSKLDEKTKKLFNTRTYEVEETLKHPQYVINDEEYALYVESIHQKEVYKDKITFKRIIFSLKKGHYFKRIIQKLKIKSKKTKIEK